MISFNESGMNFEFAEDNCYRIEEDPLVRNGYRNSTSNNMACECVSIIDGHHYFIEAKQSVPRSSEGKVSDLTFNDKPIPKSWEVYNNYQHFLRSISKKFIDSFNILRSIYEGRHGEERRDKLSLPHRHLNLDRLRFVLIINFPSDKNIIKQDLATLSDALKNEMRPFLDIWKIHDSAIKVVLPTDAISKLHIPITS